MGTFLFPVASKYRELWFRVGGTCAYSVFSLVQWYVHLLCSPLKGIEIYSYKVVFREKSGIRYYSRLSQTILSSPVPFISQIFPRFSQAMRPEKVVFSWYRQFGKWCPVSSCLVSFKTSSGTQPCKNPGEIFQIGNVLQYFIASFFAIWIDFAWLITIGASFQRRVASLVQEWGVFLYLNFSDVSLLKCLLKCKTEV